MFCIYNKFYILKFYFKFCQSKQEIGAWSESQHYTMNYNVVTLILIVTTDEVT